MVEPRVKLRTHCEKKLRCAADEDLAEEGASRKKSKGMHMFSCDLCNFFVHNENRVMRHRMIHPGLLHLRCHVCGKDFALFAALSRHVRSHFSAKPYQCSVCSSRFKSMGHLKDHLRTHTGERPFVCGHCHKSFGQKTSLSKHMTLHMGERLYTCHLCPQAFGRRFALIDHITAHGAQEPPLVIAPPTCPLTAEQSLMEQRDTPPALPCAGTSPKLSKYPFGPSWSSGFR